MIASDDSRWDVVRRAYESGVGRVEDICRRFQVGKTGLYRKIEDDNWTRRRPVKRNTDAVANHAPGALRDVLGADIAPVPGLVPNPVAGQETGTATAPQIYIQRLYALIAHQIGLIEARVPETAAGLEVQPASDGERVSRTLSTLVRALEKLIELEHGAAAAKSGQEGHSQLNADDMRDELARRIARIEQTQSDPVSRDADAG